MYMYERIYVSLCLRMYISMNVGMYVRLSLYIHPLQPKANPPCLVHCQTIKAFLIPRSTSQPWQ